MKYLILSFFLLNALVSLAQEGFAYEKHYYDTVYNGIRITVQNPFRKGIFEKEQRLLTRLKLLEDTVVHYSFTGNWFEPVVKPNRIDDSALIFYVFDELYAVLRQCLNEERASTYLKSIEWTISVRSIYGIDIEFPNISPSEVCLKELRSSAEKMLYDSNMLFVTVKP